MKKAILLCMCAWMLFSMPVMVKATETPGKNSPTEKFVYSVYGEIPTAKATFEEEHFLGNPLTSKWNTFIQNYTHIYDMSVGFSGSTVEVSKPAIYNAVMKVNKYYKKAVRKGTVDKDIAIQKLSHILDCANVISTETETETFEQAISETKEAEEIIALFDKVELKFV